MTQPNNDPADQSLSQPLMAINLADTAALASYGRIPDDLQVDEILDIASTSPVTVLAEKLRQITNKLHAADPNVLNEKPTFLASLTGSHLAKVVRFEATNATVEQLLVEAEAAAQSACTLIDALKRSNQGHRREVEWVAAHVAAGQTYLAKNPDAGKPKDHLDFENARMRFEKRLQNLNALLSAKEMHGIQLKIAIATAETMVDKYSQVRDLMVPIWRQYVQALKSQTNNNSSVIAAAHKAHDALLAGLTEAIQINEKASGG